MAAGYPTSDRICRVITKNFMAEHELQEKLDRIERKKRKASILLNLNRLELQKELESITPPENKQASPVNVPHPRARRVFILSGSTIPAERKRRNLRSYTELLQKLQPSAKHVSPVHPTKAVIGREIPRIPLLQPIRCNSPVLAEPAVKPLFTGVRAKYTSLSEKYAGCRSSGPKRRPRVDFQDPSQGSSSSNTAADMGRGRLKPVHGRTYSRVNHHSFPSLRSKKLYR